jgi:ferredoxin-NADP reductase
MNPILSRIVRCQGTCVESLECLALASAQGEAATDTKVAIINNQSIVAISSLAQYSPDIELVTASLQLQGTKAFEELAWIGRIIKIGQVQLYITAPINCADINNVNRDGARLTNALPHLMRQQFGHTYCGVYATVLKGGDVELGASVTTPEQYRTLTVDSIVEESESTVSLVINSADGKVLTPFEPGQYVTVKQSAGEQALFRHYTLSNQATQPQLDYRISVKKFGEVSKWLHTLKPGDTLDVSSPTGAFCLTDSTKIPVFIGCGIGITPLLAMLKDIAKHQPKRKVWLFYGTRNWQNFTFKDELIALCERMTNVQLHIFFSRGKPMQPQPPFNCHVGRVSIDKLRAILPFDAYQFYLCGREDLLRNVYEGLMRLGISGEHIHLERFNLGEQADEAQHFPSSAKLNFTKSHCHGVWSDRSQTLLEFSEQIGINAPADCRAGSCGACRCTVKGKVHYAMAPLFELKPNEALLCCARPLQDLEIDL